MATVVVNNGKGIVTNRIKGAGTEPLNVGWGTGGHDRAITDTTSFTTRSSSTSRRRPVPTTPSGRARSRRRPRPTTRIQVVATRTATGAGTVTVAGLFDAASGGNLFLKGDFTGIGLAIADSILFTIKAIFA
jgi:hypothetical protein